MGKFETSDGHSGRWHRPLRVPILKQDVFASAQEMCADLKSWKVLAVDEDALTINCERANGLLGGTSRIVVRVDGPDGIPSSETNVVSESTGGVLSKDKAIVSEFMKKFSMRVI